MAKCLPLEPSIQSREPVSPLGISILTGVKSDQAAVSREVGISVLELGQPGRPHAVGHCHQSMPAMAFHC